MCASAASTSAEVSSFNLMVPIAARIGSSTSLFLRTVFSDRPGSPWASQSSAAARTVWLDGAGFAPSVMSACSWRSLSVTAARVRALAYRRIRLSSGVNPPEMTPRQRREQCDDLRGLQALHRLEFPG
jgi:hypothetical protein